MDILTNTQYTIYEKLYKFVNDDIDKNEYLNNIILLSASAGTGKTFILSVLIRDLLKNTDGKICVACPTHVSLNIIMSKIYQFMTNEVDCEKLMEKLELMTIQKLLKYKKSIDKHGNEIFEKNKSTKIKLTKYKLIIVDECSMIQENTYEDLMNEIKKKNNKTKIIFNGDEFQLPPVNTIISPIFKNINNKLTLTEIVRTKSIDIMNISNMFRLWISNNIPPKFMDYKNSPNIQLWKMENENEFLEDYIKNINNGNNIILGWTNEVVDKYNEYIRKNIFNKKLLEQYEVGEFLIFKKFHLIKIKIFDEVENITKYKNISFHTSEKVKIVDIKIENKKLNTMTNHLAETNDEFIKINELINKFTKEFNDIISKELKIYNMKILKKDNMEYNICTLHPLSLKSFKEYKYDTEHLIKKFKIDSYNLLKKLMSSITTDKLYEYQTKVDEIIQTIWNSYYNIYSEIAELNYGYSMTTHKSQSATFDDVYINITDIYKNTDELERKKLLYTAITRTSNKVHLIK